MDLEAFRINVQAYYRRAGTSQHGLARALGLQPQVLSRKLSPNSPAYLTHAEVKQIVKTLAAWEAITSRSQAVDLLALMDLKATSFTAAEWDAPPLNQLEATPLLPTARAAPIRADTIALQVPSPLPVRTLPVLPTSLLGRGAELAQLASQLADATCRLLTLVGAGGIGKTSLALQAAREVVEHFADGGWITEPVVGMGLRSGTHYTLGEREAEYVMPRSRMGAKGGVYIEHLDVQVDARGSIDARAVEAAAERGIKKALAETGDAAYDRKRMR